MLRRQELAKLLNSKRITVRHLRCAPKSPCGPSKVITMKNVNPNIVKLEYAVRGPLVIRAAAIQNEIDKYFLKKRESKSGPYATLRHRVARFDVSRVLRIKKGAKKPFMRLITANIGDAHAMGQVPITFIRQVTACVTFPEIICKYDFPDDVRRRAEELLKVCGGGSVGAYTMSLGIERIRRNVAGYIKQRDGHPCDFNNVALSTGASTGIKNCLQLFCNNPSGKKSGIMVPIPQYPLYSASIAEFGLEKVDYFLDEDKNWGLDLEELERSLVEGNKRCEVRAIVVINPGNPTGQVLSLQNIEDIIKFAFCKKLVIFADEVYQTNVYAKECKFHSFKKVLMDMGPPYCELELFSFMSVSKGYSGECGMRGGWMEILNLEPKVRENMYKAISAMLCPPSLGQIALDCVLKTIRLGPATAGNWNIQCLAQALPPKEGDPSYKLWLEEKNAVLSSLKVRAAMVVEAFNGMKGFQCNVVQGAMYAFPRMELPKKAIDAAKEAGKLPDVFYSFKLLEEAGICIVPGSGFGQRPGTYHFRTTILPQPDVLKGMLDTFKSFHEKFTKEYG